jgi:sigma-E factor negative regulatory protein RseB
MKPGDSGNAVRRPSANPAVGSVFQPLVLLFAVWAIWTAEAPASEQRAPGEQLARMSDALRSLSYEGTLVYLHDNKLETLRIVHWVEKGQVRERLVSLNGPVRTLTREKGKVTCELSDSRRISVSGHGRKRDVVHLRAIDPDALADHYQVHALGAARVAGRQADVVGIVPRDGLRYGYRFYLDQQSGLPLKSDLMGQESTPIEQIMFTSLQIFSTTYRSPAAEKMVSERSRGDTKFQIPSSVPWRFDRLPAGFALVMHDDWRDSAEQPVTHFVLSDGLASVSVYVERDPKEALEGATRIGAVHAAGNLVAGHQVTVVGEVPSVTVHAVLAGLRHSGEGQP